MTADEQRVLSRHEAFLVAWLSRDDGAKERVTTFFDTSFSGFGTARHEIWNTPEGMVEQFTRECEQLLEGGEFTSKWATVARYTDDVYGVTNEFSLRARAAGRVFMIDPLRVTSVWKRFDDGEFKIVHWHCSLPDASSEEEVLPGSKEPKRYDEITVAMTDFVGFSGSVFAVPPKLLVDELNEIFSAFDEITAQHGVDKIKTIGDAYMMACGLDPSVTDHALRTVTTLRKMFVYLEQRNADSAFKWEMRAGVHSGPAVGGIIGKQNLSFDLWGDTVNLASRLENSAEAGRINLSAYSYALVKNTFPCTYRGKIETKDRGKMDMYFVN
jgi:class 3 adenylate cyclase/ketosteroid isomerase-like protein